jgi:hypothetical protein
MQTAIMPGAKKNYFENDAKATVRRILEVGWTIYRTSKGYNSTSAL